MWNVGTKDQSDWFQTRIRTCTLEVMHTDSLFTMSCNNKEPGNGTEARGNEISKT